MIDNTFSPSTIHTPLPTEVKAGIKANQRSSLNSPTVPINKIDARETRANEQKPITPPSYTVDISDAKQHQPVTSLTYSRHLSYQRWTDNGDNHATLSSTNTSVSKTNTEATPPLVEGASTILRFIEQRIATEKNNAASDETLETIFQQGLAGFEQGYGEALTILGDKGVLNDGVSESVTTLYQQVLAGFENLRQIYLENYQTTEKIPAESIAPVATNNPPAATIDSRVLSNELATSIADQLVTANQKTSVISGLLDSLTPIEAYLEYTRKDSFAFELTTRDGDKLTIQANQQAAFSGVYSAKPRQEF
jgi:hypothetical protein